MKKYGWIPIWILSLFMLLRGSVSAAGADDRLAAFAQALGKSLEGLGLFFNQVYQLFVIFVRG